MRARRRKALLDDRKTRIFEEEIFEEEKEKKEKDFEEEKEKKEITLFEFGDQFNLNLDPRLVTSYIDLAEAAAEAKTIRQLISKLAFTHKLLLVAIIVAVVAALLAFLAFTSASSAAAAASAVAEAINASSTV